MSQKNGKSIGISGLSGDYNHWINIQLKTKLTLIKP